MTKAYVWNFVSGFCKHMNGKTLWKLRVFSVMKQAFISMDLLTDITSCTGQTRILLMFTSKWTLKSRYGVASMAVLL